MSVIDLSTRITNDWDAYHANKRSSDSYVFISTQVQLEDGPASVDFTVGDRWFLEDDDTAYDVGDGIILNPSQAVLIETAERIAVPYNVFGLVTGKGSKIFQGAFISTGKINPGFHDNLRIGIYNGSKKKLRLIKGSPLCTGFFINMESNLQNPVNTKAESGSRRTRPIGRLKRLTIWLKENKEWISVIISILAVLTTLFIGIFNRNFIGYKSDQLNSRNIKENSNENGNSGR